MYPIVITFGDFIAKCRLTQHSEHELMPRQKGLCVKQPCNVSRANHKTDTDNSARRQRRSTDLEWE